MSTVTRRNFLQTAAATLACGAAALRSTFVAGFALWSADWAAVVFGARVAGEGLCGTLRHIAALGYMDVEAAGYFGLTTQQVKQAMQTAGLNLVSAHYPMQELQRDLEQTIAFNKELGVRYLICSFPGIKDPFAAEG